MTSLKLHRFHVLIITFPRQTARAPKTLSARDRSQRSSFWHLDYTQTGKKPKASKWEKPHPNWEEKTQKPHPNWENKNPNASISVLCASLLGDTAGPGLRCAEANLGGRELGSDRPPMPSPSSSRTAPPQSPSVMPAWALPRGGFPRQTKSSKVNAHGLNLQKCWHPFRFLETGRFCHGCPPTSLKLRLPHTRHDVHRAWSPS